MNALKGYFHPASKVSQEIPENQIKTKKTKSALPPPIELAVTPPHGSPAFGSPAPTLSNGRSPLTSRPSSIFPEGDFRNTNRETVLDIKADVMVTWLNQQQLEKLWSSNLPNEGVVLKKARDNFTCSPPALRNQSGGFFDQVIALNVRVSIPKRMHLYNAHNFTVCHDHQYADHQNIPITAFSRLCTAIRWPAVTGSSIRRPSSNMPEASLRRVHQRLTNAGCMGRPTKKCTRPSSSHREFVNANDLGQRGSCGL